MKTLYDRYKKLDINGSFICLEKVKRNVSYFCYPTNAKPIGFEGCVMYCFIKPYGEMVFASNPETSAESYVYPLARTFEDFLRLILACGSTNPIEQVIWMNKEQFEKHLQSEEANRTDEQKKLLRYLEIELGLSPIENPYEYVKDIQSDFDSSGIQYSNEYYDTLGIDNATKTSSIPDFCETVTVIKNQSNKDFSID